MTSVDFDLLPFNIVVYKKQQDDFLVCFLNKAIQQTEQLDCDAVLGSKVTQFIPEIKESGLFDAMLRVQLSGESELIYTAYNTIDGEKLWRQNQLIKLPEPL